MARDSSSRICLSLILIPLGYSAWSSSACTVSPVRVVVAAIRLTTTSWLARVWPRQFDEMWENSRCSIWGEMHPPDPDFGYTRYCERCVFWGCPARPMGCAAGLSSLLRRGRWGAGETDLEAGRMKLPHEPIGLALGVTATLEVVGAGVGEALAGGEHVPDQVGQAVGDRDRDRGLVRAAPLGDVTILGAEVAAVAASGR